MRRIEIPVLIFIQVIDAWDRHNILCPYFAIPTKTVKGTEVLVYSSIRYLQAMLQK